MHKAKKPFFLSRHRLLILAIIFWAAVWGAVYLLFYTFPYFLNTFHYDSSQASIASLGVVVGLIAFALGTIASLLDGVVRDRRRVRQQMRLTVVPRDRIYVRPTEKVDKDTITQ
jgi:small-conductance mechanosensitive channel